MSVEDAGVIDFVTQDPAGAVALVMVEGRDWDGSHDRLLELQEKINAYVSFAKDGELAEKYPQLAGKPVRLELRCAGAPDPKTARFIEMAQVKLKEEGLSLKVQLIRRDPSG